MLPPYTSPCSNSTAFADVSYRYAYFQTIEAAGTDWDLAAPANDIFLQRRYLGLLENYPPLGMRFGYLVFYAGQAPVGVALCQIKYFKADENINTAEHQTKDPCFFTGLAKWLKRRVAGKMAADILICGSMLLTGEHGHWFDYTRISWEKAAVLLEEALDTVVRQAEQAGERMPVILLKDLSPEQRRQSRYFIQNGFVEFEIQPNMILPLPFRDFEEYLAAMTTKYRTRVKRAFKKAEGIQKKALTLAEIHQELPRIYALYKDIANNAGFNMVDLNEHYLPALKRDMPDVFQLFAYYLDGQLVAFYSTIRNNNELEAHFLGYDKQHNHDLQLYLNILLDIVRIGIASGCRRIILRARHWRSRARSALFRRTSIVTSGTRTRS
jgi:hypothetical protein